MATSSAKISEHRPSISVLLPVHNGERYLSEAIESILGQTNTDFELLILNDGSTDSTSRIVRGFVERDSRVRHVELERVGLSAALNKGLELSNANLIARMDADDVAFPERFERQYDYLQAHPDVAVLGTAVELIGPNGAVVGVSVVGPTSREQFFQQRDSISVIFKHPTVMFRKNVVINAGGYSEEYPAAEDYELWNRLAPEHFMITLPETLLQYRAHDGAVSTSNIWLQSQSTKRVKLNISRVRRGVPPLTVEEFERHQKSMRFTEKVIVRSRLRSQFAYRRAGAKLASRDYSGLLWLAASFVIHPPTVFKRLRSQHIYSMLLNRGRRAMGIKPRS